MKFKSSFPITVSPSQIKTFECERRWGYDKIERIPRLTSPAQKVGLDNHVDIFGWFKDRTLPGPIARQAIRPGYLDMSPSPELLLNQEFERPMWEVAPDTAMIGEIDLLVPGARPLLIDHKTTKSLKYAMDSNALHADAQSVIYSKAVLEELRVPVTDARWIYYSYHVKDLSPAGVRKAETTYTPETIQPLWDGIVETTKKIRWHRLNTKRALDMEPNPSLCQEFGGCPYLSICPVTAEQQLAAHWAQFEKFSPTSKKSLDVFDGPCHNVRALGLSAADVYAEAGISQQNPIRDPIELTTRSGDMDWTTVKKSKTNGNARNAAPLPSNNASAGVSYLRPPPPPAEAPGQLRSITDKIVRLQTGAAQGVNPPEQLTLPAPPPAPVQAITQVPAPAPTTPKRGRPPKSTAVPQAETVQPSAVAPQDETIGGPGGFSLLLDVLFAKGSEFTTSAPLIEVLQPSIEKICAEAQIGHWSIAENAEARLAFELDQFLTENKFPTNFAIIADSTSKEFRAVREVLNRHATMVLRGV